MIKIDETFLNSIVVFLDENTDGYKLKDINDIVECKRFRKIIINEVSKQANLKGKKFQEENKDYLLNGKGSDYVFNEKVQKYLNSLELSQDLALVSDRLNRVIKENTYYPVDKNLIDNIVKFLNSHDDPYEFCNEKDLNLLTKLKFSLESALIAPRRLVDLNYDEIMTNMKDDIFGKNRYLYNNIYSIVGNDEKAESLYIKLLDLEKTIKPFI